MRYSYHRTHSSQYFKARFFALRVLLVAIDAKHALVQKYLLSRPKRIDAVLRKSLPGLNGGDLAELVVNFF